MFHDAGIFNAVIDRTSICNIPNKILARFITFIIDAEMAQKPGRAGYAGVASDVNGTGGFDDGAEDSSHQVSTWVARSALVVPEESETYERTPAASRGRHVERAATASGLSLSGQRYQPLGRDTPCPNNGLPSAASNVDAGTGAGSMANHPFREPPPAADAQALSARAGGGSADIDVLPNVAIEDAQMVDPADDNFGRLARSLFWPIYLPALCQVCYFSVNIPWIFS